MIYKKKNTPFMRSNAYTNCYEFMFILSKSTPKTFNPLTQKTVRCGVEMVVSNKGPDAINRKVPVELKNEKTRTNKTAIKERSIDHIIINHNNRRFCILKKSDPKGRTIIT